MLVNGYIGGPLSSILGGIAHEIWQGTNTIRGAIADIRSDLVGVVGSLDLGSSCEDKCRCEQGKNNPK